ncbi:hypothetical protein [Acidocella sp.]|uniref:autotransporter outer membrane beta-barrel domain-containing protein n=1 Tax=Acidocella sp. TaxID=50710 RepID=UPI002639758F|nr:hypothetical protein [Acidocella sp.]
MQPHPPRAVGRQALGTSCLLALPTALALTGPAAAQTIITSDITGTVNLAAYGAGPVSIASGVSISGTGLAAISGTALAQLANAGQVADAGGTGISLGGGGTFSNTGSVSGANGVKFGAAGSIANAGAISAANYGVLVQNGAGQVGNTGSIAAGYDGVSLDRGGGVTNSGTIFGAHIGVYTGNALGSVSNSGTISARTGDAVSLYSGGGLTNMAGAALLGGYSGVYAGGNGARISNAGLITGPLFGAYLMGASTISNSGTMAGGTDGIMDFGRGGVVGNTGLVHGGQVGIRLAANGAVENAGIINGGTAGIKLGINSTLANDASGHIAGGTMGVVATAGDVLTNAGSIGGQSGIIANGAVTLVNTGTISAQAGGDAISLSGGASSITLGSGSEIDGDIAGNGTASQISLTGSGTLAANLTGFAAGSTVNVSQGAVWTGQGQWQVAQLVNSGVFTPGVIGAALSLTGNFVQGPTGTLRVLVTPSGISSFAITGTAVLGGTLNYTLAPGTFAPGSATFLTASGGITGNFAQTTTTQAGLTAPPLHLGQGGVLSLGGGFVVAPAGVALFADTTQAMAVSAEAGGQALLDHAGSPAATPGDCAAARPGPGQAANMGANMAVALASGICAAGGWMQVTGDTASASGAYTLEGGGVLAGIDRADGLGGRIGLAMGYDTLNLREKAAGTAGLRTIRLGLYAAQPMGRFELSGAVMDSIATRDTTRITGAAAATASGHANLVSGVVQLARPLSLDGAVFTPAFGLQIASITAGRLSEASATRAFAVNVAAASGTTIAPYIGMTIARTFVTASELSITPSLSLGGAVALSNPGASARLSAQDGTMFIAHAQHMAPFSGQLGAGIAISRDHWSITARYTGAAGGNWLGQSLQAGVQARF